MEQELFGMDLFYIVLGVMNSNSRLLVDFFTEVNVLRRFFKIGNGHRLLKRFG